MDDALVLPFVSDRRHEAEEKVEELPVIPRSVDAEARRKAIDPHASFIVEAPAGSGKTGLLVQRFLHLLGNASAPEELLCITFTRKATAELRERIFSQLQAASVDQPLETVASPFELQTRELAHAVVRRDTELGWRLLEQPHRLRVQTIDALCMQIGGTLPLLSGTAGYRPVDDASALYRQAARNTLLQLGGSDLALHGALETVLRHRDGSLVDVETLLADMLSKREQWAELVPLDSELLSERGLDEVVRPRLERGLESMVCAELTRASRAFPSHALDELAALAHEHADSPGHAKRKNPLSLCREHNGPPAAEAAHLDHWHALLELVLTASCGWRKALSYNALGVELSKEDQRKLKSLIDGIACEPLRETLEAVRSLPSAKYPDDQWRQAKALFRLLLHALAELKLLFAERGECDFTEFSLAARQALAERPEDFARSSGVTLRHLLVDEMQDTSSAQYDLLTALTRSWDGSSQTVFLVGDPKQSIYLFRQARVERFLRTATDGRLGDVPLQTLQLTANFRSRPALVDAVNADAARLFVAAGESPGVAGADVPFVAAVATRSPAGTGVHWHTRVSQKPSRNDDSPPREGGQAGFSNQKPPAEQDAAAIRAIVERWQRTPLPPERQDGASREAKPWRIAILANTRAHLAPIAAEFRRSDEDREPIPYRAINVETLGDRPEVLDVFALARALHHPADRTAWFAVLRAPWCGLGAADLLTIAREENPSSAKSTVLQLLSCRTADLSADGARYVSRILPTLQAGLEALGRADSLDVLKRVWMSMGMDAGLSAVERRNVEKFFELLTDKRDNGVLDFHNLKEHMTRLYADTPQTPGAVDLMTIHGAKGLEWDVVLVPDLGRRSQRDPNRLLNWLELETGGSPTVLLAPIPRKGERTDRLYGWLNRVHTRRTEGEHKRVFYVASTRAREELHLFATARETGRGAERKLSADRGSLLNACWQAAEPHFSQVAEHTVGDVIEFPVRSAPGDALSIAASEDAGLPALKVDDRNAHLPRLSRLPLSFDPLQRFRKAALRTLPYAPASESTELTKLSRPEGSLSVRAFGNVVHRFLQHASARLAQDATSGVLLTELPTWIERITASFRAEGLAPAAAGHAATSALEMLSGTLRDPVGRWLLAPHADAGSEHALESADGLLRVDRTFRAGSAPEQPGDSTLWVVDFKATLPGGRSLEEFFPEQRKRYSAQLHRYANILHRKPENVAAQIRVGLYFPAVPRLLAWNYEPAETA